MGFPVVWGQDPEYSTHLSQGTLSWYISVRLVFHIFSFRGRHLRNWNLLYLASTTSWGKRCWRLSTKILKNRTSEDFEDDSTTSRYGLSIEGFLFKATRFYKSLWYPLCALWSPKASRLNSDTNIRGTNGFVSSLAKIWLACKYIDIHRCVMYHI